MKETTLHGHIMPGILKQIRNKLASKGFTVQILPVGSPVIIASIPGNWLRSARQLVIEFSNKENDLTRVEITAIVPDKRNNKKAEVLEAAIANFISNALQKINNTSYGI